MRKRVVLDSRILNECFTNDENQLYRNIKEECDHICLTSGIKNEYKKDRALSTLLFPELKKLEEEYPDKVEYHLNLNPKPNIQGIKKQHRIVMEDAIRIKAAYLITVYEYWIELGKNREFKSSYNIEIIYPDQYIEKRQKLKDK